MFKYRTVESIKFYQISNRHIAAVFSSMEVRTLIYLKRFYKAWAVSPEFGLIKRTAGLPHLKIGYGRFLTLCLIKKLKIVVNSTHKTLTSKCKNSVKQSCYSFFGAFLAYISFHFWISIKLRTFLHHLTFIKTEKCLTR